MRNKGILLGAFAFVIVVAGLALLRDEIAIAFMERETAAKPKLARIPLPEIDPVLQEDLAVYIESHHQTPEDYIVSKFADHDIVFVGENHRFKHDGELIQSLIPRLHEAGVYNLGIEFAVHREQPLIDELVTATTYDEQLARRILFSWSASWAFQEYVDIYRAAWEVNQRREEDTRPFRVVGLDSVRDFSHVTSGKTAQDPDLQDKIWPEGPGDIYMGRVVIAEFVEKHEKALVYCGMHHSFTKYREPAYSRSEGKWVPSPIVRMGHVVYDAIGDRAMTISLHYPWGGATGSSRVHPLGGAIDVVMRHVDPGFRRVGFDTRGTPFGQLPDEASAYKHAREQLVLEDFCDGYVYQRPFNEYEMSTWIDDFINNDNVAELRRRISSPVFREGKLRWMGLKFIKHYCRKGYLQHVEETRQLE